MKKLIFVILILFTSITAFSQIDKSTYYSYGTQFYVETMVLPSESVDSINVMVMYKIMYDALAFEKEIGKLSRIRYTSAPKVEITFKDETGIIRNRKFRIDSIFLDDYDKTNSKKDFHLGILQASLPYNNFDSKFNIYENKNSLFEKEIKIEGKEIYNEKFLSLPMFVYNPFGRNSSVLEPMVVGNNMLFDKNNSKILFIYSYEDRLDELNFSLKKIQKDEPSYWKSDFSFSGRCESIKNSIIANNENIIKIIDKAPVNNINFAILEIELPEKQMTPGNYEITLKDNIEFEKVIEFEVIWNEMPLSLENPDYAVDVMYYILSEDEYDLMDDGEDSEKITKIANYWKEKDPTPETPYNEAMVEYFKRVDYAYFNYQTIQENDGAKSQRGKIYILYGKPDDVTTELISDNAREIWRYKDHKKEFVFENTSPGVYELAEVNELE